MSQLARIAGQYLPLVCLKRIIDAAGCQVGIRHISGSESGLHRAQHWYISIFTLTEFLPPPLRSEHIRG